MSDRGDGEDYERNHGNDDDDFDYQDDNRGKKKNSDEDEEKHQKIENHHYDEAVEVSGDGSEIQSDDPHEEQFSDKRKSEPEDEPPQPKAKKPTKLDNMPQGGRDHHRDDEDDEDEDHVPGGYNPADFKNLNVADDVREIFQYITRFRPENIDLETPLRPFIPDYIPAIGEVDAFLKPSRPGTNPETLGLGVIDEPALNQSKESTIRLLWANYQKVKPGEAKKVVDSVKNPDKNPKAITQWINDVTSVQKQPPHVSYSKPFPHFDSLLGEWPPEIEEALHGLRLPTEELDVSLEEFTRLACAVVDIPIHNTTNNKNLIESLHVFFTLYSEFRANQHFQQNEQFVYGQN